MSTLCLNRRKMTACFWTSLIAMPHFQPTAFAYTFVPNLTLTFPSFRRDLSTPFKPLCAMPLQLVFALFLDHVQMDGEINIQVYIFGDLDDHCERPIVV